jgi:bud emergence protein 1
MRMSKAMGMGKNPGSMVYGVVMYDFKAERADELDAKEGEAIIVIAQSNPEWFVAKPITRLGGPGLIPVSFIEIRDMATNKPVEDPQESIRQAGVPKVEEWKKMAADYKNGSIPLGKLDSGAEEMQQGMTRMSLNGQQEQQHSHFANSGLPVRCPSLVCTVLHENTADQMQPPRHGPLYGPQSYQSEQNLLAPARASVPRYCFSHEIFWFVVEAEMEDGGHWELQRLYQDFYDLQINLIQAFPREAGNVKGVERCLPYMPGPVTYVTDNISNGRRANLDEYIRNLLKLGSHITRDYLVCKFFAPREGDYEIDPDAADQYRISSGSQGPPGGTSSTMSPPPSSGFSGAQTGSSFSSPGYGQQRPGQTGRVRSMSGNGSPPLMNSFGQQQGQLSLGGPNNGSGGPPTLFKIKVFFGPENCVVIRLPPEFQYADLYKKLQERRRLEPGLDDAGSNSSLEICWRNEGDGTLWRIDNDQDLQGVMSRTSKLTLNVRPI